MRKQIFVRSNQSFVAAHDDNDDLNNGQLNIGKKKNLSVI